MPEEDQPPEQIWGNDERLIDWFEGVKFRRDHADAGMEAIPQDAEMTENSWVRELLER